VLVHDAGAIVATRTLAGAFARMAEPGLKARQPPSTRPATGIEATLAVDVVGPLLLTLLLAPRLAETGGRVVSLAGQYYRRGHLDLDNLDFSRRPYNASTANAQAQRGRVLIMREAARRLPGITSVAVHPGAVRTAPLARAPWIIRALVATVMRPAFVRPELGAMPVLRLATTSNPPSGAMFDRFTRDAHADHLDPELGRLFWDACERLVA